eukprot:GDKK01074575.1.p1 GENE.GDKK01074575.1~~GDKK01074575.1.p1  ORF type:complete len:250 (+),score=34.50 GDKK01074575.1:77-826(+)
MAQPAVFTKNEERYFRKMFHLYDTDKSGSIGMSELKNLTKSLGVDLSEETLLQTVAAIGCPTDGEDIDLDFPSFVKWFSSQGSVGGDEFAALKGKIRARGSKSLTNEQISHLKEVFDHFDADQSNSIDADELVVVFASMGQEVTREAMVQMIATVDNTNSGDIDFEEFIMMMCTNFGKGFKREMEEAFEQVDPGDEGRLPVSTVAEMMRQTSGGKLSETEISEILASISTDGWVDYRLWESLWDACDEA